MSRGIGKTQRRILDTLAASDRENMTVVALATHLGSSPRQIRRAVHSLADRGYVLITSSIYAHTNGTINAPYAMSKAGVAQLGRALGVELAGTGARQGQPPA